MLSVCQCILLREHRESIILYLWINLIGIKCITQAEHCLAYSHALFWLETISAANGFLWFFLTFDSKELCWLLFLTSVSRAFSKLHFCVGCAQLSLSFLPSFWQIISPYHWVPALTYCCLCHCLRFVSWNTSLSFLSSLHLVWCIFPLIVFTYSVFSDLVSACLGVLVPKHCACSCRINSGLPGCMGDPEILCADKERMMG